MSLSFRKKFAAALMLATALTFPSASANAQADEMSGSEDPPVAIDQAEALALDARIYAETFGVSFDEAVRRMLIMHETGAEVASVEAEEGSDFAGSFFDNRDPDFGLVVKTKKATKAPKEFTRKADMRAAKLLDKDARAARRMERKALRAQMKLTDTQVEAAEAALNSDIKAKVKYRTGAAYSLSEMEAAVDAAISDIRGLDGFAAYYIDEMASEVVVLLDAASNASATNALRGKLKVPFRVELRPGGFQGVAFRGGQVTQTPTYPRYCMTAFGARHNTAKTSTGAAQTGVVTARHCNTPETISLKDPADGKIYPLVKGAWADDRGGSSTSDLRFLYHGSRLGSSAFYFDSSSSVRTVTGTRSRSSTTARSGATNGSFICHLGQSSLGSATYVQSCGEVISKTTAQNFDSSGNLSFSTSGGSFVMVRNTQSGAGTTRTSGSGTLKCYQGDSGGPWFAYTIAYGVMSACSWSDVVNGTAAESVYTSTDYFSQIGVSILVN